MKTTNTPDKRSRHGLESLNFFLADVQTGVGPFLAIYLAGHNWDEQKIGIALTVGGIAGIICQTPVGALIDKSRSKRALIACRIVPELLCATPDMSLDPNGDMTLKSDMDIPKFRDLNERVSFDVVTSRGIIQLYPTGAVRGSGSKEQSVVIEGICHERVVEMEACHLFFRQGEPKGFFQGRSKVKGFGWSLMKRRSRTRNSGNYSPLFSTYRVTRACLRAVYSGRR